MTDDESEELLDKYGKRMINVELTFIDLCVLLSCVKLALESPKGKHLGQLKYADKFQKHLVAEVWRFGLSAPEMKVIEKAFKIRA